MFVYEEKLIVAEGSGKMLQHTVHSVAFRRICANEIKRCATNCKTKSKCKDMLVPRDEC